MQSLQKVPMFRFNIYFRVFGYFPLFPCRLRGKREDGCQCSNLWTSRKQSGWRCTTWQDNISWSGNLKRPVNFHSSGSQAQLNILVVNVTPAAWRHQWSHSLLIIAKHLAESRTKRSRRWCWRPAQFQQVRALNSSRLQWNWCWMSTLLNRRYYFFMSI